MCEYNKGCALGTLIAKGYKNIRFTETACAALSDSPICVHEFTWDSSFVPLETVKSWAFFRFKSQKQILSHMESAHQQLHVKHEELKSLQEFYSHVMANMDEAVLWCETNGSIAFCNPGFSKMTGQPDADMIGKKLEDIPGLSWPNVREIFGGPGEGHRKPHIIEIAFKQNGRKQIIGEATVLFVPQGTRKAGFLIVIRDVTRSRIAAKQLSLAENRYRSLYENSPALIVGLNTIGKIIYANRAMVDSTGFTEEELKTMDFVDLLAPDSGIDLRKVYTDRIESGAGLLEVHFRTKNGQWKAVTMSTYPLQDEDGNLAGLAGIGVDITETQRLNEQIIKAQRMELLGQLAGGLAHDFRNILASISGFAELIRVRTGEEKTRKMVSVILDGTVRADELIRKLLSFSRGDTGESKFANVNLCSVVNEAGRLVLGAISSSVKVGISVPDEPLYVSGDAGGINQCILNLCMNAKDALKEKPDENGFISVRLKADATREKALIEVEDNGPGIPPHLIEKIFDPFFTTKKDRGGTGLGLSVVYGIVKTHRGKITLDSRPGQGATFTIELPLAPSPQAPAAQPPHQGIIAVLDDEPGMRAFCSEVLQHYGYEVVTFSSVDTTIKWLSENKSKAWFVLSDIYLPGMEHRAFAHLCSKIDDRLKIMWMSGAAVPASLADLITPVNFISKPFSPYGFIERIKSFASGNEPARI
jgi:PAS domain S-box-containing protein